MFQSMSHYMFYSKYPCMLLCNYLCNHSNKLMHSHHCIPFRFDSRELVRGMAFESVRERQ